MKVVTWNIGGGHLPNLANASADSANLKPFLSALSDIGADVVCLQEVHLGSGKKQSHQIAEHLGYDFVYNFELSDSHIEKDQILGLAILSRLPVSEHTAAYYPQPEFELHFRDGSLAEKHRKGYQLISLENGVQVLNTHFLPLHAFGYTYESHEVELLSKQIDDELSGVDYHQLIMCGDWNHDAPASYLSNLQNAQMRDLVESATKPNEDAMYTHPDHIFCTPDLKASSAGVIKVDGPDHYPCWASINRA